MHGGLLGTGPRFAMHEQEIDVARVVQLGPPELAERDHREQVTAGRERQRLRDARVGDLADLGHHVLERRARQVAGRDPQHRPSPEPPEPGPRTEPVDVGGDLGPESAAAPSTHVGERLDLAGVRHQEVGRRRRESEESGGHIGDLGTGEGRACRRDIAHPGEGDAGELGIGGRGEGTAEHLGCQHPGIIAPELWGSTECPTDPVAQSPRIASASISTFQAGSRRPATTTIVLAGRTSPKTSPCARPASCQSEPSVR